LPAMLENENPFALLVAAHIEIMQTKRGTFGAPDCQMQADRDALPVRPGRGGTGANA
jgi:hypothetical protein